MISRVAEPLLQSYAENFPVLSVTGPRQSGKTTLVRNAFPHLKYVSLENPDDREFALEDPKGFLKLYKEGAIFDEIQKTPDLISYLQQIADETQHMGRFVLTGSQALHLSSKISQSLAGRTANLRLLPFQISELRVAGQLSAEPADSVFKGFYPPIYDRKSDPYTWYSNYIQTYLEKDVRDLIQLKNWNTFAKFLRLLAGRTGQILNLSSLADDTGVSHNTIREWISVLEASFIIFLLQPYHNNFNKRLIKSPKIYFTDSGLAACLLGIENKAQLTNHPLIGALYETAVIADTLKNRLNRGLNSDLFFWRDQSGMEVDLLEESGGKLKVSEIKSAYTVSKDRLKSLFKFKELTERDDCELQLIYSGDSVPEKFGVRFISFQDL
jgi:uncharacterized protein